MLHLVVARSLLNHQYWIRLIPPLSGGCRFGCIPMNPTSNKIRWKFSDNDSIFFRESLSNLEKWTVVLMGLFCLGLIRKIVLDCVPECLIFFSWSSTNRVRRWMDLNFVFSILQNLAPPSFDQIVIGFHYDSENSNLIGLDEQTFNTSNEHIVYTYQTWKLYSTIPPILSCNDLALCVYGHSGVLVVEDIFLEVEQLNRWIQFGSLTLLNQLDQLRFNTKTFFSRIVQPSK